MPFLGIETSDTGMSVFALLAGKNKKRERLCLEKWTKKARTWSCPGGISMNAEVKININK
ncbi:MAG: hypothetical protein Q4G33_09895 [bacterium]|nr:hypothetical protein [bacterium]